MIAKQENGVLVPYKTSKGRDIVLLREGTLNINQMFSAEHFDARLETWKLRGVGMFVLYAASVCLAKLLKIICEYLSKSTPYCYYALIFASINMNNIKESTHVSNCSNPLIIALDFRV